MISAKDLQRAYVNLYRQLRNYVWDVDTVEHLANFEIEVYNRFPDLAEIKRLFEILKKDTADVVEMEQEDSEVYTYEDTLEDVIKAFDDVLYGEDANSIYSDLYCVEEIEYEDKETDSTGSRGLNNNGDSDNGSSDRSDSGDDRSTIRISGEIHRRD